MTVPILFALYPNFVTLVQGLEEDWGAVHDWVTPEGCINLDYLEAELGNCSGWATNVEK